MRFSNGLQECKCFVLLLGARPRRSALLGLAAAVLLAGISGCSANLASAPANDTSTTTTPPANPPSTNPPASNPPSNPSQPSTLPSEQASSAASFVNSVGVVTHLSYTNTAYYTNFPQILASLQSLGVHHIRDGYSPWPSSSPIVQAHGQLAAAGIKCDYVVPFNSSTTAQSIQTLAAETGDMESIEPPNECDVDGNCGGNSTNGIQNVVAFLPTLKNAAKNLNVPLLGPSFTQDSSYAEAGDLSSQITVNNLHVYFGGRNPGSSGWGTADAEGNSYGSIAFWLDQANTDAPGLPSVITESGYLTYPETTTPYTIPESVQASYAPRTLLVAFNKGIQKTYLYELLDEVSSPAYGLLRADLSPRPAFTAIKNLLGTLNDPATGSFTPASLEYSITGGDSSLNHLLLEKHDGSFWLVLWLEEPRWDPVHAAPLSVAPETITLTLPNAYVAVTSYQFDTNGNIARASLSSNPVSLTISDQIAIIQITPQ